MQKARQDVLPRPVDLRSLISSESQDSSERLYKAEVHIVLILPHWNCS